MAAPMGNLLGSWRVKEPSTIEECDSTWGSDSEGEEPPAEDDSGISDSVSPADSERAAGDASPQVAAARCSKRGCVCADAGRRRASGQTQQGSRAPAACSGHICKDESHL